VLVDPPVIFAGDGGSDDIGDTQHTVALALCFPLRLQRVDGLTALADRKDKGVLVERSVAVPELAGVFNLDGDPGVLFNQVFGNQAGMPGSTAAYKEDPVDLAQLPGINIQAVLLSKEKRPRTAFSMAMGCSKISLSMKWA